jgi:hypothetical protein
LDAGRHFQAAGFARQHWSSGTPIRKIFRKAFGAAGLPYFNPHSFRNTLVRFGERCCQSPEEFKAWSQNLGHEKVLTTFSSYGDVPASRQAQIMKDLVLPRERPLRAGDMMRLLTRIAGSGATEASLLKAAADPQS